MTTLDTIRKTYADLQVEIAADDAKAAPIIAKGKAITAQVVALQAQLREISKELAPLRNDDYRAKRRLLGQLAVALGGKVMVAEAAQ